MRVETFELRGNVTTVLELLTGLGFVFDPSQVVTTTLIDTFDARLHRAGLRLQVHESGSRQLELTGKDAAPVHLAVDALPRAATDLPPGAFRSALADLTGGRALIPQLQVGVTRTSGVWRGSAGKVVASAELHRGLHVIDRPDVDCPETTIEIRGDAAGTKQTRRLMRTLSGVRAVESHAATLARCAAAAGIDLAGFTAAATVPLDPGMAAIDGFRLVSANLAATIGANWEGTIDQTDPEFLHDLRIAVRRTRTVLAAAKHVLPPAVVEPTREGFAWLAGLTGPPRDLDVYLLEWQHYTGPLGAEVATSLEPVRALLQRRCSDAHLELERALRSRRALDLVGDWRAWLDEPTVRADLPLRAGRPLGRIVGTRIARGHRIVIESGRLIGPDTPSEQIHDLRKDAKQLRYLLECFGSLLPDRPRKRYVKRLRALQDNLGQHQDAEVHINMLRVIGRQLRGASPDTMAAIGQLTEQLDRARIAARVEFAERFADYDTRATQRALDALVDSITD